jgi:hypothetical protein
MKTRTLLVLIAFLATVPATVACTGDDSAPHETLANDSGSPGDSGNPGDYGGGADGGDAEAGPPDCYTNPKTHYEIINACTNAARVDKNPKLPLLQPDGSLPPLP